MARLRKVENDVRCEAGRHTKSGGKRTFETTASMHKQPVCDCQGPALCSNWWHEQFFADLRLRQTSDTAFGQ